MPSSTCPPRQNLFSQLFAQEHLNCMLTLQSLSQVRMILTITMIITDGIEYQTIIKIELNVPFSPKQKTDITNDTTPTI